jgi:glutamate synthase (NADPH) small chain
LHWRDYLTFCMPGNWSTLKSVGLYGDTLMDERGFLHYARAGASRQGAAMRVRHWHEYEYTMPAAQAMTQAKRCMDCGTPCCHSHCPVHNLIPEWNLLVSEGDWYRAWQQLESTNNFPEFTGRICGAPCEAACTLGIRRQPVTIRSVELAIVEHAWQSGWIVPARIRMRRFQRVAVVGSGPAGLACAQQLNGAGYRVTIYDGADRPGGLLRYGIPDFRLEKSVLDRRLRQLRAEGVRFCTGTPVNSAERLDALRRQSHAVVLACGAQQARELAVPGHTLPGVHYALEYLEQQNRRVAGGYIAAERVIHARDKVVAVIGGGDTGGDCVGTALRQGARAVYQIQYHDCPPPKVDNLLYWPAPAPEWHATDHDEEGCRRIWGFDTTAVEGAAGRVCALQLARLRWERRAGGGWDRQPVTGMLRRLPVQLVLVATGFRHVCHAGLVQESGLQLDEHGNIRAAEHDFRTSLESVFTCGDARRGQSLVVWAIREGRQCARAVDIALSGDSLLPAV